METIFGIWWAKDCMASLFASCTPSMLFLQNIILTSSVTSTDNIYAYTKASAVDKLFVQVTMMKFLQNVGLRRLYKPCGKNGVLLKLIL